MVNKKSKIVNKLPVIFLSLVTSFALAPRSEDVEEEGGSAGVEEEEGGGGGAGVLRSWTEPAGGSARGSGGCWGVEEVGVSEVEASGTVGGDEEAETLFSLLSLRSSSERLARSDWR